MNILYFNVPVKVEIGLVEYLYKVSPLRNPISLLTFCLPKSRVSFYLLNLVPHC